MTNGKNEKLTTLAQSWIAAKQAEDDAKTTRLGVEGEMITLIGEALPDSGTYKVGGVKILCAQEKKWDQDELDKIAKKWPKRFPPFPFRQEWKADGHGVNFLREKTPEAFKALTPALIEEPKKPGFSVDK